MKKILVVVFGMFIVSSYGCGYKTISHGTEISQQEAASIQRGKTTKSDVFLKFGEPSRTADDENVFFYSWTRGQKAHFLGIGSGDADANTLVIIFDDKSVVKDYRITRGAVDSGQID